MPIKPRTLAYLLFGSVALLCATPFLKHKWDDYRWSSRSERSVDVARITVPRSYKKTHQGDYQLQVDTLLRRGYTVQCTYPDGDDTVVVLTGTDTIKPSPLAAATKERLRSEWQALVSRRVKMEWAADRIYGGTCPFCRVLVGQPYYSDQYPPSWPEEYCDCIGDAMHLVESKRTTP